MQAVEMLDFLFLLGSLEFGCGYSVDITPLNEIIPDFFMFAQDYRCDTFNAHETVNQILVKEALVSTFINRNFLFS